jgi:hypothetical protein
MTEVSLPKDEWTLVISGVTSVSFNLKAEVNNKTQLVYHIHTGSSLPDDNSPFITVDMSGLRNKNITFNNSSSQNIYVKAINSDGVAITY